MGKLTLLNLIFIFLTTMIKPFKASISLIAIILLLSVLSIMFITKDKLIHSETITQHYYHQYLKHKLKLIDYIHQDKTQLCNQYKKEQIDIITSGKIFQFFCKNVSIFTTEPNKKKYISFTDIQHHLDIKKYQKDIIHIRSLNDLPKTSIKKPRIVIADNAIDERLKRNFYGIIITHYYFDIKGKKFYGKLYSSYDNKREERNLSYKKSVINNLKKKYGDWTYIPRSQNILNGAK
ncbi:DUF2572 family protein [Phocoenobacter skyensis]|nr:DUF2572 family protein [Pasteurella skyensis]